MDDSWRADIQHHKILVTIDEGCGFQKIAGLHIQGEGDTSGVRIDTIQLQPGRNDLEQKAVIDADGNLLCGEEKVGLWLRENPGEASQIIENWKLALCQGYTESWAVKKLYKALRAEHGEVYDVERFLTSKFRQARDGIPKWYRENSPKSMNFPAQYWNEIRIEAMITVPCMWEPQSECVMRNAAAKAGFEKVQLLLEPLCAAALDIQLLKEAGNLKYGAVIAWHDIGCATNDFATVRVGEPAIPGGPCQLEIVGTPAGHRLGAHVVQDMAWEYVQASQEITDYGGMRRTLSILGRMSEAELARQVSAEIEIRKKIHPVVDFSITITAHTDWRMVAAGVPHMSIRVSDTRMQKWLDRWTLMLGDSMTKYLTAPEQRLVTAVVTTGGGSKNATVRAGLQKLTAELGIAMFDSPSFLPVAHGGLRQYPRKPTIPLPEEGYWFITRSYELNTDMHADVIEGWKRVNGMRYDSSGDFDIVDEYHVVPLPVPALVTKSAIGDGDWIVHDRLTPILSRHNAVSTTYSVPMEFYVDADSPCRLTFNVYYSNSAHRDQEPLRDSRGLVRPEFTTIQMTFADIPSLEDAGFVEEQHGQSYFFHLQGLTKMQCRDDHLELEITLFAPGGELAYIDNEVDMTKPLPSVFHIDKKEIWDINRTHFIPDSEGLNAASKLAFGRLPAQDVAEVESVTATTRRSTQYPTCRKTLRRKLKTTEKARSDPARAHREQAKPLASSPRAKRNDSGLSSTPSRAILESSPAPRRSDRRATASKRLLASRSGGTGSAGFGSLPQSERTNFRDVLRAFETE